MKVQILNPHIPKNRSVWIISNVCNSYFLENIFSSIFIIQVDPFRQLLLYNSDFWLEIGNFDLEMVIFDL